MPELPEVQTVVDYIAPRVAGKRVKASRFRQLNDHVLSSATRRGKYIIIAFKDLEEVLAIHLRMTGRIVLNGQAPKHTTFTLGFTKGCLHLVDVRKFGTVELVDPQYLENKLGPEPLSKDFTASHLNQMLKTSKRQLKQFLLDQSKIAGLGNIYVDEVLWYAKLHPQKLSNSVSKAKAKLLHEGIRKVLKNSLKHQGTTFINFSYGQQETGNFASQLKVFNQEGQPCPRCHTTIQKIRVAQRGTHICPRCQKQ